MAEITAEVVRKIFEQSEPLYKGIRMLTAPPESPLLLAHYTSVQVVEQILRNDEIWLSNPLYMNDLEEMRSGVILGTELFPAYADKAGGSTQRGNILRDRYNYHFEQLSNEGALDTYVFCLCEHQPGDADGKLSMWREYGSKGNGAALVFNPQRINYQAQSPLYVAEVLYQTKDERKKTIDQVLDQWAAITLSMNLQDHELVVAAHVALLVLTALALTTKHKGFEEEGEWRVIYSSDRDWFKYLHRCKSYFVGLRGVEPKLKLRFDETYTSVPPTAGIPISVGTLSNFLDCIILGPTVSSPLSKASFIRMLEGNDKAVLGSKILTCGIPLRAT